MTRPPLLPPPDPSDGPAPDDGWRTAVRRAAAELAAGGRLVVTGAWGAGKTRLVEEVAREHAAAGRRVLRIRTRPQDAALDLAGLGQLRCGPGAQEVSATGRELLGDRSATGPGTALALRLGLVRLLGERPTLLVVDGAPWLDTASRDVLGYALQVLPGTELAAVATERGVRGETAAGRLLGGHPARLAVPGLSVTETARLLDAAGLPVRWAGQVHRRCGGHRLLTGACLAALAAGPPRADRHAPPWPAGLADRAAEWLGGLPEDVRAALLTATLATRPSAALLRRAGHPDAEELLERAADEGVLDRAALPGVVFTAGALAAAAADGTGRADRSRAHRRLAGAVDDPVHRVRHLALAHPGCDQALAEDAEQAAATARAAGDRVLAAELLLLSAELTAADRAAHRMRRLADAARAAAAAGLADLARQAAGAIEAARGTPEQQTAALLAVIDAQGQDLAGVDLLLARARHLAAGRPALLAAVELRAAITANIADGDPAAALDRARAAAGLAAAAGDPVGHAAALTMTARMERVLGDPAAAAGTLARALALDVPAEAAGVRNSARYLAARHAVFDDRLAEARTRLLPLLALAERAGDAEDIVDVVRSLAEVDARAGACARALHWAERALALTAEAGLSPGPAWYTAALAQAAGGSLVRAEEYASQGVRASREEHDGLYTARNLWVLATVRLHTGRPAEAAARLHEVAALDAEQRAADPTMLRWGPDAVEALATAGRPAEARALLAALRAQGPAWAGRPAMAAALLRGEAHCVLRDGSPAEAGRLLAAAVEGFRAAALPLEEGRTLLAVGRLERARRRQAAARTAWEGGRTLFAAAGARPWLGLADELLSRLTGRAPLPGPGDLTEPERRLAALVSAGATNQEAAGRLYVSVKTVEGMLSRIYRKLGVRSRTQLAGALPP
ncbi:AAA family ATPase [Streptomyces sp. NPDC089919]|uniref:helix-turn-helix transcriptional regulator n=1 Tax=Streptomyces sp. NPDC089919 TaxID=3155188 RepID=UPI00342D68AC